MMKKIAIQTAVTLRRNGTLALASAIASVLPAAAVPSRSSTTPATENPTRDVALSLVGQAADGDQIAAAHERSRPSATHHVQRRATYSRPAADEA